MISPFCWYSTLINVSNCKMRGRYLFVLLIGNLQKLYSVFHVLPFLRMNRILLNKIFHFQCTAHNCTQPAGRRPFGLLSEAVRTQYAKLHCFVHELHWLRVPERVTFRLCVLVYRCLHGTAPTYLGGSLLHTSDVDTPRRLRPVSTLISTLLLTYLLTYDPYKIMEDFVAKQ